MMEVAIIGSAAVDCAIILAACLAGEAEMVILVPQVTVLFLFAGWISG